jgi:hypothetical protein
MKTRFNLYNNFEAKTTDGNFVEVFDKHIFLYKNSNGKKYDLAGLTGKVKDAFIKTFGKDLIILSNLTEVENALKQIIITLEYKVGNYNIEK